MPQLPQAVEMQNNCNACVWQQATRLKSFAAFAAGNDAGRKQLQRGQLGMS